MGSVVGIGWGPLVYKILTYLERTNLRKTAPDFMLSLENPEMVYVGYIGHIEWIYLSQIEISLSFGFFFCHDLSF